MATETTFIQFAEGSAPSTPASTKWRVYAKTDGLYYIDDAGVETGPLGAAGASLGAWTDYTPTWSASGGSFNLGSSSLIGRYKALDSKTYAIQINLTITTGGAWNPGTGTWQVTLPAGLTTPNVTNRDQMLMCHVLDSGTTNFVCVARVLPNTSIITEINVADGTNPRVLTNNAPITWATNDKIDITGIIEVA